MSNLFISTALMTLAEENALDWYGYKPSSLIAIIGAASGILSAMILPFMGAVVDCTPHRRTIFILSCMIMMIIQCVQIVTIEKRWFMASMLQALNGFIFQVMGLTTYSYLPEIGRSVGTDTMTEYTAEYSILTFVMELFHLVLVVGISYAFHLGDVQTGQLGQMLNIPVSSICYYLAWRFFSRKKPKRKEKRGESLILRGFSQVFKTEEGIRKHYGPSLGWFLMATMFAEAGASTFTLVAVTYLKEVMEFGANQIGILFFIVIVFTIPGSMFGAWLTKKTCPKVSMELQLVLFMIVNFVAFLTLTNERQWLLAYIFGGIWGILFGWFYPCENLIFSMIMPRGQEAELAGFYLYCTQILCWFPPLVFTLMNEGGIPLNWGGMHLNIYFALALLCYMLMLPWDECITDVHSNKMLEEDTRRQRLSSNKESTREIV